MLQCLKMGVFLSELNQCIAGEIDTSGLDGDLLVGLMLPQGLNYNF
mgnify:CR=1 FL=1